MSFNKKPKTINPDEVDPSVYYYDEVYDEMKEDEKAEHEELHGHSSNDKKQESKYIQGLKETAELRKVEKELRKFKRYARDREEAGEFSDKDVFITSAYKEKLEEMKRVEDERRKLLELEEDNSMNFIKKQKVAKEITKEVTKTNSLLAHPVAPQLLTRLDDTKKSTRTQDDTHLLGDETQDSNIIKRKPITLDERREYLRQVLSKRTVGTVYEEAVQRYIERKALAQP